MAANYERDRRNAMRVLAFLFFTVGMVIGMIFGLLIGAV